MRFTGEVLTGGMVKAMTVDTAILAPEGKLARVGLLVINPLLRLRRRDARCIQHIVAPLLDASNRKHMAGRRGIIGENSHEHVLGSA